MRGRDGSPPPHARIRRPGDRSLARKRERAVVKAAQRGSNEAMEEFFRRHWRGAHRAAYLVVHDGPAAEDIAQEAFISAIRSLDRFDRRRPFAPWLHRIVVNRAIDWTRAGRPPRGLWRGDRGLGTRSARARLGRVRRLGADGRGASFARTRAARGGRVALPPRVHAGRDRRVPGLPRGTVNSRLRRGLDALTDALPREAAMSERDDRGESEGRPARSRSPR